jgi:hypothetical protein
LLPGQSKAEEFASLAEEARQQNHSHLHCLEALLLAEVEECERRSIELRIKDAHLPRVKTLEELDFAQSPHIPASLVRALAEGGYSPHKTWRLCALAAGRIVKKKRYGFSQLAGGRLRCFALN